VTKRSIEPNLAAVVQVLKKLEKPLTTVPEELKEVSDSLGDIILEMRESIVTALESDKLRQVSTAF